MTNSNQRVGTRAPEAEATLLRAIGRSSRVIVVGSINIDLVATVERLPGPGETVTGGHFARHHGGKGGNQAVAAARLGAPTWFVGAVGDDDFGAEARSALAADEVDTTELVTLPAEATGVALILVDAAGENCIAVASGANAGLTPERVADALGRLAPVPGDVVLVGHEIPTTTATEALRRARAAGATTVFDPAPAAGVTPEVLALTDILTPNHGEAGQLLASDAQPDALATDLLGLAGGGHVLITLGAQGARLYGQDGATTIPAPAVIAIDTVGAGDALNGALVAGLAARLDLEMAARRAVTAATLSVTRAGAREGMPSVAELGTALSATASSD